MPVYIEDVSLTPAMDIKIGSFHSINVFDKDFKGAVELIINNIPKENFVQKTDPFFENEKWKLYLTEKEVSDRGVVSFSIAAKNDKEDKILFTYPQMGPFELNSRINKCEEIEDDFFNEEGKRTGGIAFDKVGKVIQVNEDSIICLKGKTIYQVEPTGNISGSRDLTEEEMAQLGVTYGN